MIKRFVVLFTFLSSVTACGFQLRGSLDNLSSTSLEGKSVYITSLSDKQSLEVDIRHVLRLSKVNFEEQPQDADYQIIIVNSSLSRFASGLDTNGRINEYEFIMQLDFVMVESGTIINEQKSINHAIKENTENELQKSLKVSRHFYFETNDLVGKKTEENTLLKDMKSHIAIQFLQQFSAFNNAANQSHNRLSQPVINVGVNG